MGILLKPWALATIYAVYALMFVVQLAIMLPPLQAPDEGAHLVRAEQISRGGLVATRLGSKAAGGMVPTGTLVAIERFYPIVINQDLRVSRAMFASIPWGALGVASFPNTAIYPPFYYLPASLSVAVGKRLGLDVLHTTTLMRVTTGLTSIGLSTAAIGLADESALWLFALLLLPTSAMLMSSISQDGPMLASAAMATSLTRCLSQPGGVSWRNELISLALLLGVAGMARPPYIVLAVLPLITSRPPVKFRLAASIGAAALSLTWCVIAARYTMVSTDPTGAAHPSAQLHYLLTHPSALLPLGYQTLYSYFSHDYAGYFISLLDLNEAYYVLAWCCLMLAAALVVRPGLSAPSRQMWVTFAAVGTASLLIFAIQYLTWTPVGAPAIAGVQGRYFLPLAAILAAGVPAKLQHHSQATAWLALPVILFPIGTLIVVMQTILWRFYL